MLLFYSSVECDFSCGLKEFIHSLCADYQWEQFNTLNLLTKRLTMQMFDVALIIIIVYDQAELADILTLRPLIIDLDIVLVLPDPHQESIRLGHKLHPRYMGYLNSDGAELLAVVAKMINNIKRSGTVKWKVNR